MLTDPSLKEIQKAWHGSLKAYLIGFISSLFLTILSFSLVGTHFLSGQSLVYSLIFLALLQAVCQLIFFLHLGQEEKPRWETLVFGFMLLILLIIVIGSLWIMHDLHQRGMQKMHTHFENGKGHMND